MLFQICQLFRAWHIWKDMKRRPELTSPERWWTNRSHSVRSGCSSQPTDPADWSRGAVGSLSFPRISQDLRIFWANRYHSYDAQMILMWYTYYTHMRYDSWSTCSHIRYLRVENMEFWMYLAIREMLGITWRHVSLSRISQYSIWNLQEASKDKCEYDRTRQTKSTSQNKYRTWEPNCKRKHAKTCLYVKHVLSMKVLCRSFVFRQSMSCHGVLFPVVLVANAGLGMVPCKRWFHLINLILLEMFRAVSRARRCCKTKPKQRKKQNCVHMCSPMTLRYN